MQADECGLGLVELMIAVTVLMVAVLSFAGLLSSALVSINDSRQRQQATAAATLSLELARSYAFSQIANRTDDTAVDEPSFEPLGPGVGPQETILRAAGGRVTGPPHQVTPANPRDLRVRTYVTRYEDPQTDPDTSKRITAVVSWQRDGGVREIRESTIIGELEWSP